MSGRICRIVAPFFLYIQMGRFGSDSRGRGKERAVVFFRFIGIKSIGRQLPLPCDITHKLCLIMAGLSHSFISRVHAGKNKEKEKKKKEGKILITLSRVTNGKETVNAPPVHWTNER